MNSNNKRKKLAKIKRLVEMIEKGTGKKVRFIHRKRNLSEKQIKMKKMIEMIEEQTGKKVMFQKKRILKENENFIVKCNVGGETRYFSEFKDGKPQFTKHRSMATVFTKSGFYTLIKGAIPMYEPEVEPQKNNNNSSGVIKSVQEAAKKKSKHKRKKKYPWKKCEEDAEEEYGSKKQADKVCGAIKARAGK